MSILRYIFIVLLLSSCADKDVFISITDPVDTSDVDTSECCMEFYADMKGNAFSKSSPENVTPFPKGCFANIYAYKSGENPKGNSYYSMRVYKSESIGALSAVGLPLSLPQGEYDIYATASTSIGTNQGPSFTNGTSKSLLNKIDYLWWSSKNVKVNDQKRIIPIVFEHCCAQIIFVFSANDNMKVNSISEVKINLGKTSQNIMNLATGNISYAKSLSKYDTSMKINDMVAYVITLPIQPKTTLEVEISASVTIDILKWWWFEVELPLPSSGRFEAGKAYIYSLVFDKYEIWGFGHGDGKPLEVGWVNVKSDGSLDI